MKPYDREEDRNSEFEEAIRKQSERQNGQFSFDFPEFPAKNFLKGKNKDNFNNFHEIIFNNPSFTVGELQELEWMGEILEDNSTGPIEGS